MRIHVDIGHAGHVHFFRNAMRAWSRHGHVVTVSTRRIPIAMRLMDAYEIPYSVVSRKRTGKVGLGVELMEHAARLWPKLVQGRVDVCTSIGGTFMVHAALLAGAKRVVFYDTDTATDANRITYPFASRIVTPEMYPHDLGSRHVRYRGFHELAYLHPARFQPSREVVAKYGLSPEQPYSIVRFIAWEASHDIGVRMATPEQKRTVVETLGRDTRVVMIPESSRGNEFRDREVAIKPEDFHHLLAHATCCVTEGATTASEACMLGTPVLYLNPLQPCYIHTLADTGLLEKALPGEDMTAALKRLRQRFPNAAAAHQAAERLVQSHIDVTAFVTAFIEDFGA